MNAIECLMLEHRNIERMLNIVRKACYSVLQGQEICFGDFKDMIEFIRNYADAHHHGKEEDVLFLEMKQRLGAMGENLITHGMLVEHDLGRLYIKELEKALARVQDGDDESKLDVISNANGYASLLNRHIIKEDSVVYPFGVKKLDRAVMNEIETKCDSMEQEAIQNGIQTKYLEMLDRLEAKYIG